MIKAIGNIYSKHKAVIEKVFLKYNLEVNFIENEKSLDGILISFDKNTSRDLSSRGVKFYNWDLLFSKLGPHDTSNDLEFKLEERVRILESILSLKSIPLSKEFHGSIRVHNLAKSAKFYTWLFGLPPKEWTHRYVTFYRDDTKLNFVLLVSDGKELHHDTLYHLGMGVESKNQVIEFYRSAQTNNFHIEKPPRTTWRGTPLHELWLKDPDGTLIEVYARLSEDELKKMPSDMEPIQLA